METQLFIILVAAGLFLMGAEIFVPGGILGLFGGIALLGAIVIGYQAFGPQGGTLAAILILVFLAVSIVAWMILIPRSRLGRVLTLSDSTRDYKGISPKLKEYVGQEGIAITPLSPSGVIKIGDQRIDVVAEGKWIDKGSRVRIVSVTGNHVTARKLEEPPQKSEPAKEANGGGYF